MFASVLVNPIWFHSRTALLLLLSFRSPALAANIYGGGNHVPILTSCRPIHRGDGKRLVSRISGRGAAGAGSAADRGTGGCRGGMA